MVTLSIAAILLATGVPSLQHFTQRQHMKLLLAQEEKATPHLFANMLHAMRPLMGQLKKKDKTKDQ